MAQLIAAKLLTWMTDFCTRWRSFWARLLWGVYYATCWLWQHLSKDVPWIMVWYLCCHSEKVAPLGGYRASGTPAGEINNVWLNNCFNDRYSVFKCGTLAAFDLVGDLISINWKGFYIYSVWCTLSFHPLFAALCISVCSQTNRRLWLFFPFFFELAKPTCTLTQKGNVVS